MTEQGPELWRPTTAANGSQLGLELERLPGVVAAAVWLDEQRGVSLVRVHAQPSASTTILTHTITRVLEQRGFTLDPAVLRIAQAAALGQPAGSATRFLVLHDLTMTRQGSRVTSHVRLACENAIVT